MELLSAFVIGAIVGIVLLGVAELLSGGRFIAAIAGRLKGGSTFKKTPSEEESSPATELYRIAGKAEEAFDVVAHPSELLSRPEFQKGVKLLRSEKFTIHEIQAYATGSNSVIASMALEALCEHPEAAQAMESILSHINEFYGKPQYFALRALSACPKDISIGKVLTKLDDIWLEPFSLHFLKEFLEKRLASGEAPGLAEHLSSLAYHQQETLEELLKAIGPPLNEPLLAEFEQWKRTAIDVPFLKSFGKVWETRKIEQEQPILIEHPTLCRKLEEVETALKESPRQSVLLVGESGVGKSTLMRLLARRLLQQGWILFEAGGTDIQAGQVYYGQMEGRITYLLRTIGGGRKVVWLIPQFHELIWAGRKHYSPISILDMILPAIETGDILVVGEIQPPAFERLMQHNPRMTAVMRVVRLEPLSPQETLKLAREWVARRSPDNREPVIAEETLGEAIQLTQQYLGDKAAPGNLLEFLDLTWRRLCAAQPVEHPEGSPETATEVETPAPSSTSGNGHPPLEAVPPRAITLDDMLITLSQLTGLPVSILDDRQGLNLEELERFFRRRIFGQPEAIECLVERIAMIKAGLTDPTRPQGVFLFAGPTGTGKTEIAKALAEYLFGSPQRMIRLDMSEFQTPESVDRILGIAGGETTRSKALVNLIRKQPFSVILLDEFEKAAPNIWDLFLQVFDDGRLTDHHGNTADFRHCIIIMTSNLGGVIPTGDSIGFTGREGAFTPGQVGRAIERTFRKEFLNRLDRIVVFHPFNRATMREILLKELNDVLNRRGLRTRSWAVEWHDSAIDFLLEKGFTADLGARPLKRAIERYLLSPLARTIVNHQFPEGDQFLFVRSDGKCIEVEFVDPDAPEFAEEPPSPEKTADTETEALQLPRLVLEATGTLAEVSFLRQEYERLSEHIRGEEWERKKQGALEQTSAEGFWESPGRFTVLGLVEYMDRIEVGLSTAGRLLDRLIGSRPGDRRQFLPRLVQQLAHQLYLIDAACRGLLEGLPQDAFVEIRATHDRSVPPEAVDAFARRLAHMYRRWVEKRRMRLNVLQEQGGDGHAPYHALLAITGYAAYSILRQENGLHVLELPGQGKAFRRGKVHVRVVPQPEHPPGSEPDALYRQCVETLAATRAREEGQLIIVRRYREEPSPLVRDSVRKWRTGRLDRVLDGDFDLVG